MANNRVESQIEKNRSNNYSWDVSVKKSELVIKKETEKAILVMQIGADMRERSVWLPKSMLDSYWFVNREFDKANMLLRV